MTLDGWPTVELGNVRRMRVLNHALPSTRLAEAIVDAPFERVWTWFSDLEHSVPAFDGQVRRLRIRQRDGEHLKITAWQGPGARFGARFDVLLEPNGWCLMTSKIYLVGMCAEPVDGGRTHVAVLEGVPGRVGRFITPFVRRHVRGDVSRIGQVLGVDSRPV